MNETHGCCEGSTRKQEVLLPDVPPSTEVARRSTAGPTRLCRAAISQFKMSHREIKPPLESCGLGRQKHFFPPLFFFLSAGVTESCSVPCDYSVTPGGACVCCCETKVPQWSKAVQTGVRFCCSGLDAAFFNFTEITCETAARSTSSSRFHHRTHIFPLAPARPPSLSLTRPLCLSALGFLMCFFFSSHNSTSNCVKELAQEKRRAEPSMRGNP